MSDNTFLIDCSECKARVAAIECGMAETGGIDEYSGEPYGNRLYLGKCPQCKMLLTGVSHQRIFYEDNPFDDFDEWTEIVRVYPEPAKQFYSGAIPKIVRNSIEEANKCLQIGALTAACAMMGRALEALCRDIIAKKIEKNINSNKKIMLSEGIKTLKDNNIIDERLFKWSQELKSFRDISAHPDNFVVNREDAEDLSIFVHAIIEYIYDLTERYDNFKRRVENKKEKKEL